MNGKARNRELDRLLNFMVEADKLKRVDRTGWVELGIRDPESVADHSYSVAILSYLIAKRRGLDEEKTAGFAPATPRLQSGCYLAVCRLAFVSI